MLCVVIVGRSVGKSEIDVWWRFRSISSMTVNLEGATQVVLPTIAICLPRPYRRLDWIVCWNCSQKFKDTVVNEDELQEKYY